MNNSTIYAALDVGGTFIKYTLVSTARELVLPVRAEPVPSLGTAAEILTAFRSVAANLRHDAGKRPIGAVGVAICGPMDYPNGIFQMNEDKYRAVYGVDLKAELRQAFELEPEVPVNTAHDVQSFLLGNAVIEPKLQQGRIMTVTLGTGIGSAYMVDGRITAPGNGVPDRGIGRLPYGDSKVENFIGAEALRRLYPGGKFTVKELAAMAEQGDNDARAVFQRLGEVLSVALRPVIAQFRPELLILGGQIARAETLFLPELRDKLTVPVRRTADQERAALLGAIAMALSAPRG